MRQQDLNEWLELKETREILELIKEHREAPYKMITEALLNVTSIKDIDLTKIAEFRGQVQALDAVLDIEMFTREIIEERKDETVHPVRFESDSQS